MPDDVDQVEEQPREGGQDGERGEKYRVAGERLLSKVKELIKEGNVRRITIKNEPQSSPCGPPWGPSPPW
jgi:hypothetical protein